MTTYTDDHPRQAERLAQLGATDDEIADFFNVSTRTLYRWRNEHPAFCHALKLGKDKPDDRVVRSLYQRANGFKCVEEQAIKVKEVVYSDTGKRLKETERVEVVEVERQYPPDTVACIFWLKNRDKSNWRDKIEHEVEGKGGFALVINESLPANRGGQQEGTP